jgi:hypothetical protein
MSGVRTDLATLQAQVDLAPDQLAAAQATQPGYDRLSLESLNRQLFGDGGTGGYLDAYEKMAPRLSALNAEDTVRMREADVSAVERLGPRVQAALMAADPELAALLEKINAPAMGDLEAGDQLTPAEARMAEQSARASGAARGMSGTNVGASMEVLNQFMLGQNKKGQRMNTAMGVAGLNKSIKADPYQVVLGRASNSVNQALVGAGQGARAGELTTTGTRGQFDPFNAYAGQLFGDNYRGQMSTMDKMAQVSNTVGSFVDNVMPG